MKHWMFAAFCSLGLAGCASDYVISTNDGQMITAHGEPKLDEDSGLYEYEDADGRTQQIPLTQVKQVMER